MLPRRHSLSCACVALAAMVGWIWVSEERRSDSPAASRLPETDGMARAAGPREAAMESPARMPVRATGRKPAGRTLAMPLGEDFTHRILSADRSAVSIPVPGGGTLKGTVRKLEMEDGTPLLVEGTITHPEPGRFHFRRQKLPGKAGPLFGFIHFDESPLAWQVRPTGADGTPELVRVTVDEVICRSFPAASAAIPAAHPVDDPIPVYENEIIQLQSLPGAEAVVYLDFDGEQGNFEGWEYIGYTNALPSGATNQQIFEVWQGVCEDFQPFNINITTIRSVFEAAPRNQRMQVIVTPTDDASPGDGGRAIIGSFNSDGDIVCWAFHTTGKNAIEVISHEVGHTLGLSHDGLSPSLPSEPNYYEGHFDWAPIMGVGYSKPLTQWSKGEYTNANNDQDDLLIISSNNNGVAYRADDHGSNQYTASWLDLNEDGDAFAEGIIETRTDRDSFRFSTFGGDLSLAINPVPPLVGGTVPVGNLDIKAELLQVTSSLTSIIATSDPGGSLAASFNIPGLAAGDYLVRVSGTGRSNLVTGYSDYASLGSYTITGNVDGGVHAERFVLAENSANGTVVGSVPPRADHSSGVLNFEISQDNAGGAFQIDPATGEISVADGALLDFEALSSRWDDPAALDFIVTIGDSLEYALEAIRVVVVLTDENEPPVLESIAPLSIPESVAPGTPVTHVRANDPDRADFVTYSIVAGNDGGVFDIDPGSGLITVAGTLDYQAVPVHYLMIRAADQADPPSEALSPLAIQLLPLAADITAGSVTRTFYNDIPGSNLADLTGSPRFPEQPDGQTLLTAFDTGSGTGFQYGSVVSGYVIAPAAGNYTFWISAGESGELWLSPDMEPENAVPVAVISSPSAPGEWNKEAGQQSAPVALTAGGVYYIEARHKQGWGTDHVQVAWQEPGMTEREIIPGLWLAPDDRQFAPWAEDATLAVRDGAAAGTMVGAVPFTEPNLGQQVASYAIIGGNEDGNFTIDPADGTIRVAEGASFAAGAVHPLTIAATDDGDPAAAGEAIAEVTVHRLDEGLFAWWQLDETAGAIAFDSSGNQRNAWLIGNAAWLPRAAADQALQLDGIDAGFSRYDDSSPAGLVPLTVAAWVKVPPEHAAEAVIVQQAADPVFVGPGFYRVSVTADGNVRFVVYGNNADASEEGFQFDLVTAATIHDGQWHHVACVRDGEDGRVFIDGVDSAAGTGTPRMLEAESTISVGYDAVSFSTYLKAAVDDVRIYEEALAELQIARIAAAPKIAFTDPVTAGDIVIPDGAGLMLGAETSSPSGIPPAIAWSLVSGPGGVVFDDPASAATGVSFSAIGTYVLRATAASGNDDVSRDISVTYGCTAITPFAGGQTGTEGAGFHTATGPGAYLISGDSPGMLVGGTSDGFYLLGQVFAGDFDVRVRVDDALDDDFGDPFGIAGLVVRAGDAGATDDAGGFIGLRPESVAGTWIRRATAGAANVVTDYPGTAVPYWCRITRGGGDLVEFWHSPDGNVWTSRGTMSFAGNVNVGMCWSSNVAGLTGTAYFSGLAGFSTGNLGPGVNAGPDFSAETTLGAQLAGVVTDDGLPAPPAATTIAWQVLSGPGPVDISDASDPLSAVTFGAPGEYVLRLLADDDELTTFNDVTVTVTDPLPVLSVEATTPDAAEEGPVNGVFTITREVWLVGDLTVDFTLGGDAENILDYDELPTSVIIPDGEASVEIVVAPVADGLVEGPETVTLTLAPGDYLISGADAGITIADSNHAPEWASPVFAAGDATQDVPYSDSIVGSATDPDAGDELVFTKETGPAWLEIATDGTLSGTPLNGDVGLNEFTVRVTDSGDLFAEATLEITVQNVNDPPEFGADPVVGSDATEDVPYSGTLAGTATDPDAGDELVFTKETGPEWLEIATDGTLTGTPGASDVGLNQFTIRVTDGGDLFAEATLEIQVAFANEPPTFAVEIPAPPPAVAQIPYGVFTLADFADDPNLPQGDEIVFSKLSGPEWLEVAADGTLNGTPGTGDIGANLFDVRVTDIAGDFADTTLEIAVGPTILYLDVNGETAGSGADGAIAWDDSPVWSAEPDGVTATHAWVPGATAVLAAGDDAGTTSITLDGTQSLGALIVEEGAHSLTGGTLALTETDAVFDIATDTAIESQLSGTNMGKTGTATLTLAGSGHSLTGELAVIAGTLQLTGSLTTASGVSVAAGATLAGDGTVAGGVSVTGTLSPGADLGTLTTGPLAINGGSTLAWRIDSWTGAAGTDHDLVIADSLDLSGTLTVVVDAAALADFTDTAAQFTLVSTSGGITGFGSADFVINTASLPQATGHWDIVQDGDDLVLSYTPLTPFEQWQLAQFVEKSTDPLVAGELADPDSDGLPNLVEYALGTDPQLPGPSTVTQDFVEIEGISYIRLTAPRNPDATDIGMVVETTSDLSDPGSWTVLDIVIEIDEPALLVVRDALGGPRRFMRLRVTR